MFRFLHSGTSVRVKGHLEVFKNGKRVVNKHNLVVDTGFNDIIRTNMLNLEADADHVDGCRYVAVGTGTTAAAAGDTALGTETAVSGLSRALGTYTEPATKQGRVAKTFSVTGTVAVTEAGLLNAAAAGILLNRQVFAAVNVVSGDELTIQYTFTLS